MGTPEVDVAPADRAILEDWAHSPSRPAALAQRARIVLLAAAHTPEAQIAAEVGVSRPTVTLWNTRYVQDGLAGLDDRPRPGRPRRMEPEEILAATLANPPADLGVTHWSSRLLATHLGIAPSTVLRCWHTYGLQPTTDGQYRLATEPPLVAEHFDVVGLYLHPALAAVVLRSTRRPPHRSAGGESRPSGRTWDGETLRPGSLQAALTMATESPRPTSKGRRGRMALARFLDRVLEANADPSTLHVVLDGPADLFTGPNARHVDLSRLQIHHAPSAEAWLAAAEVVFTMMRDRGRPGSIASPREILARMNALRSATGLHEPASMWLRSADLDDPEPDSGGGEPFITTSTGRPADAPDGAIVKHNPIGDQVYTVLEEAILSGQLKAGTRLRVRQLADMVGTSVMPVRDAIARLEEIGLAARAPHKGSVVREFSVSELIDIYSVRILLEVEATRQGAGRVTAEDLAAMDQFFAELNAALADGRIVDAMIADTRMLRRLYAASGNAVLAAHIETLWKQCHVYRVIGAEVAYANNDLTIWKASSLILDAARRHDGEAAA
jgi:DNA-binding GntR family transcriptional regulator/transposase